jgi:hypothetical protein
MEGYFRTQAEPATPVQRFLWFGLERALDEALGGGNLAWAAFGETVGDPATGGQSLLERFKFAGSKARGKFFNHKETRLEELFASQPLTEQRVFIILTDAIPSEEGGVTLAQGLVPAIKQSCFSQGVHLWIVGLQAEFEGSIYPETPDLHGNRSSFSYQGPRPVFLWVGADRAHEGALVVKHLVEGLRREVRHRDLERQVRWVALTSQEMPPARLTLENRADEGFQVAQGTDDPQTYYYGLANDQLPERIEARLKLRWAVPPVLPRPYRLDLRLEPSYQRAFSLLERDGRWWLSIRTGRSLPETVRISGRVVWDQDAWWREWTTEDDSMLENAGRSLFFGQLVEQLRAEGLAEGGREVCLSMRQN